MGFATLGHEVDRASMGHIASIYVREVKAAEKRVADACAAWQ